MKKIWLFLLLVASGSAVFVYYSPMFEKKPPVTRNKKR